MSLTHKKTQPEADSFVIGDIEVFPAQCTATSFFVENGGETFLFVPATLSPTAQRTEAARAISEKGVLTV